MNTSLPDRCLGCDNIRVTVRWGEQKESVYCCIKDSDFSPCTQVRKCPVTGKYSLSVVKAG